MRCGRHGALLSTPEPAQLAAAFEREHGRPPTAWESLELAQQATLATRGAKHEPRGATEQRTTWRAEAAGLLGPDAAKVMIATATGRPTARGIVDAEQVDLLAGAVVATVQAHRATWQEFHLRAEAERHARIAQIPV